MIEINDFIAFGHYMKNDCCVNDNLKYDKLQIESFATLFIIGKNYSKESENLYPR